MVKCSENMQEYFEKIENEVHLLRNHASICRAKNLDVASVVEIPLAKDMADRVEGLVGPKGVAQRIRDHVKAYGKEQASLEIAKEIVLKEIPIVDDDGNIIDDGDDGFIAEQAVRTALAILTEGIVAAPLEGISAVKVKDTLDGSKYLAIYFAGPIRSAGGTAQALAVLVGDYIRKYMKLSRFDPTDSEIERYIEEIDLYRSEVTSFQYNPTSDEVRTAIKNIAIEVTGETTDNVEVSGYRDLARVETNCIRGGALLAIVEGALLKAPKILRHVDKLGIEGWEWLKDLKKSGSTEEEHIEEAIQEIDELPIHCLHDNVEPKTKYIGEIIGGRPAFSGPCSNGGFRLRYGRSRNTGFATYGFHPATMIITGKYMAIGTQLKVERPGKATCVVPVDSIDPPIVRLKSGEVLRVETAELAQQIVDEKSLEEILFLGDVLITYGDFLENNHKIIPSGWVEEWYEQELQEKNIPFSKEYIANPSIKDCMAYVKSTNTPLHPRYTYYWNELSCNQIYELAKWIVTSSINNNQLIISNGVNKKLLELIGISHSIINDQIVISEYEPLLYTLGIEIDSNNNLNLDESKYSNVISAQNPIHLLHMINPYKIMWKTHVYIGMRMGRPEKADFRGSKKNTVHGIYPIGNMGGKSKLLSKALTLDKSEEFTVAHGTCPKCGTEWPYYTCPKCGSKIDIDSTERIPLNIRESYEIALTNLKISPLEIPTVKLLDRVGTLAKLPERMEKAILRSKNGVPIFKDGTARFDCTDIPLTHFKPIEIHTPIHKLIELGYTTDIYNRPLTDENQILELKVQDVLVPTKGLVFLANVARYIDELMVKFYHEKPIYNLKSDTDIIGQLVIGMAPHTSAGMVGRIIGHVDIYAGYAHPYFHASKRRNCDGDEDGLFLLMDAFLNFSKKFLPNKRGGQMDAPLVLTTVLDPKEVDGEVHNMDTMDIYPLKFYTTSLEGVTPKDIKKLMEIVDDRLGKESQYENIHYTHETTRIDIGPKTNTYSMLESMYDKTNFQLDLATKIRAIEVGMVAEKVIQSHFVPDIMGNFRAYSRQQFRCSCSKTKYRRLPISGICPKCGKSLIGTISEGGIRKYLDVAISMAFKYNANEYVKQRLLILKQNIDTVFLSDQGYDEDCKEMNEDLQSTLMEYIPKEIKINIESKKDEENKKSSTKQCTLFNY